MMVESPHTRESLILRLPTATDAVAWQEFAAIYEPLIYRFARRRGLQDADARELVQNVFVAVARAVVDWKPDPARGKFRTWLFRIARNQLINLVAKRRPDGGSGKTSAMINLQQVADWDSLTQEIELDYRRELFRAAALNVREQVQDATWQAFWKTCVENMSIEQAAQELTTSSANIYIARSRVLRRLRELIEQWESEDA